MLKLFIALNIFLLNIYACSGDCTLCKQKIIDSKTITNQNIAIPLKNNQTLIYSKNIPNAKIIKHDPFLSLYIVKTKKYFKFPFILNTKPKQPLSIVDNKNIKPYKIIKNQVGLSSFAKTSSNTHKTALVLNNCCELEALQTPDGIIQKSYLKRFLKQKSIIYGDIGIRVKQKGNAIIIQRVDPFFKNNPFEVGDTIVSLDDKKIKSASIFMRKILFSSVGTYHKVKVKRDSQTLSFKLKTDKRYGGGYEVDTFLERRGLYLNNDLSIKKVSGEFKGYGFKMGDKIIQVEGKGVKNLKDIARNLKKFNAPTNLLIRRKGFEFFIGY